MSSNPTRFSGQPSARAIGSHIAITSGVRTIGSFSRGAISRSASKLSSRPHSEDAGDQMTGLSRSSAIRASASPDATICAATWTGLPPTSTRSRLNASISGARSFSFSGE